MKVSKNFDDIKLNNNKYGSLIINNKNKKIITRSITNNYLEPNIDNNIHLYCHTTEKQPIESYNYSNINLKFKKQSKYIYFKNKLKKNLLLNNNLNNTLDKRYTLNTIDFKEGITPTNKAIIDSKINKNNFSNTLRKNKTGLQLNKEFFEKINNENRKGQNTNKSLKNLNLNDNKINLQIEEDNKIINSYKIINNNKLIKLKRIKKKNVEDIQNIGDIEEERINNNHHKTDEVMSKELFNLLLKRLNKSIEDNEKDQKIIKKLKEENNKLKQKILLNSKNNEIALKKKLK